jgi:hypothetical protein
LETNDDELETLRVEIIQLREDFLEIEAEVAIMARRATTTTAVPTPTTTRAPVLTPTTAALPDEGDNEVATPTVPVGLDEDTILTATYQWGPSDPALILQELLGITADGWYGNGTRGAHLAELESRGLDTSGVPSPPTTTTEVVVDETSTEGEVTEGAATEDVAEVDATVDATTPTTTTVAPAATTTTTAG